MKILNYTPHAVVLRTADGDKPIQSVGCARTSTTSRIVGEVVGIPVMEKTFGEVYGLPESVDSDTILIVSSLTAEAMKAENHPLLSRAYIVNDTVRDERGFIVACTSLAKI